MNKQDLKCQGDKILLFFSAIKKAKSDGAGEKVITPLKTRCVELLKAFIANITQYEQANKVVEIEIGRYKKTAVQALKVYGKKEGGGS